MSKREQDISKHQIALTLRVFTVCLLESIFKFLNNDLLLSKDMIIVCSLAPTWKNNSRFRIALIFQIFMIFSHEWTGVKKTVGLWTTLIFQIFMVCSLVRW